MPLHRSTFCGAQTVESFRAIRVLKRHKLSRSALNRGQKLACGTKGRLNSIVRPACYSPSELDLTQNGPVQAAFHERAAAVTRETFGKSVFVRGVVELSNFCRQNCHYCGMRRDNRGLHRFRAQLDQLAELLIEHRPACITDVNLQAGEDPVAVRELVLPLLGILKRETRLGLSVCLGSLAPELYEALQAAGASFYVMKFECSNHLRYDQLSGPGTLAERTEHIHRLAANGWHVSSGFIAGLPGETPQDLVANLRFADALPLSGCSVSPFVPGETTPLAAQPPGDLNWTLNCIAALRLLRPEWIIPAVSALNIPERDGYCRGLRAGANLATINLTPNEMRENYVIYKRDRFIMTEQRVLDAIAAEGLEPSRRSLADFFSHPQDEPAAPLLA